MRNHRFVINIAIATASFLGALSHSAAAVEISPSPINPAGNTITVTAADVESNSDPYENYGDITIASGGKLTTFNQFDNFSATYHGAFTVNLGGRLANSAVFTVDQGSSLNNFGIIDNNARKITNSYQFYNYTTGVINNNIGALLTNTRYMYNYGAVANTATFFNASLSLLTNNGRWTNSAGSNMDNSGSISNFGVIDNSGYIVNHANVHQSGDGKFENFYVLNNLSGGRVDIGERWYGRVGSVINNGGDFNVLPYAWGMKNEGAINNLMGGTFNNSSTLAQSSPINNAGTFNINTGASVTGITRTDNSVDLASYTQTAGLTVVNGTLIASIIDIQGGSLMGAGTISGPVLLGAAATVKPGNSLGTLNIDGAFTSDGKMVFEISGLNAGQYDALTITGAAIFTGGTLEFDFLIGFNAAAGNSWDFLFAGSYSGQNNLGYVFNGLAPGLQGNVSFNAGHWNLSVVSVPEPATAWLLGFGLLGLLSLARRQAA